MVRKIESIRFAGRWCDPCLYLIKKLPAILLVTGFFSCNQAPGRTDEQTLDFGSFTIKAPRSWTKITKTGIDSYIGSIAIDNKDTLHFDLGWYANKLYEPEPVILDSNMLTSIDTSMVNAGEIIFVRDRRLVDPDKYRKNNVTWDTIDGHAAKIVYPRQTGTGTTGLYIDSLWRLGSSVDRFNLYGKNLAPENEKKVLAAIKTLKFYKR